MKALLQLLREFWLPLLLAVAWTAYNFIDRPFQKWTVREFLNVFGPTFFFVSWLVAQWFRVKKQQRVEDGLSEIRRDVKAIQAPLLPAGLFLTSRAEISADSLERLFKDEVGYHVFGPDKPMPPPPEGLPPGVADARLFRQGGYVDYEGGVAKAAGIHNLRHPGYNSLHRAVEHTFAELSERRLATAQQQDDPLLMAPSPRVEIFFEGAPKSESVKPSLTLLYVEGSHTIGAVRALDTTIVVDHYFHLVPDVADQPRAWSTTDLKGAFVRVTMKYLYIRPFASLPPESWPSIHNLQLWFGPKADRALAFSSNQLSTQAVGLDPAPLASGQAECVRAIFAQTIDSDAYAKCLYATA